MHKIPFFLLSLVAVQAQAQSILSSLTQHQGALPATQSRPNGTPGQTVRTTTAPEVTPSQVSRSSGAARCEENDQTSLPLNFVTSLLQERDPQLRILHDGRSGRLTVSAPEMIGNCSSMLEWTLKKPEIQGQRAYALEVKIKQGENCTPEGCTYRVAKVENGEFKEHQSMVLKPTMKGFEECLQKSGVVVNGRVVPGAIYTTPVNERFDGVDASGKLYFLSHGPASPLLRARHGSFEYIDGCDHYEAAHPTLRNLVSADDAERQRLDAEAARLRDCRPEEYARLADFIDRYEGYAGELGQVRDRLILEAAKKAATNIEAGRFNDEDMRVINDFDRYIVQPKIERARALYEEMIELEGDAKKAKQDELVAALAEISALNRRPYFMSSHITRLVRDGRFDEAERINNLKLSLEHHQRLGARQDNVVITPGVASQRIAAGRQAFGRALVVERERYEYRTGQSSGRAAENEALARRMRNNIQVRNQNFMAEMQEEAARAQQPNGYCYRYWRNAQRCVQETMERLQELQALLTHYNNVDEERAREYDAKAREYGELEAQGRRHVAQQNGEEVPAEQPRTPARTEDTTVAPSRPRTAGAPAPQVQDPGPYRFPFPQPGMVPQGAPAPVVPIQNNNFFAQTNQPQQVQLAQQAYNFNWGAPPQAVPAQFQQGPQYPFWNQPGPTQSYSIFGRTW